MSRTLRFTLFVALLAAALVASGCGKKSAGSHVASPNGGGGGGGGGPVSMMVDGVAWSCDPLAAGAGAADYGSGAYGFSVSRSSSTSLYSFTLGVWHVNGPGTYPLGVNYTTRGGGLTIVTHTGEIWMSPLSGDAGTVTITTLTASRIAGTFSCNVDTMFSDGNHPRHALTSGSFDLPIVEHDAGPADPGGNVVSCTAGGVPWNGATVVGLTTGPTPAGIVITASNTRGMLEFSFQACTGTGTYPLGLAPGQVLMSFLDSPNSRNWIAGSSYDSLTWHDSGHVTVTDWSLTHIAGTFAVRMASNPGSDSLQVTNGSFDVQLQQADRPQLLERFATQRRAALVSTR